MTATPATPRARLIVPVLLLLAAMVSMQVSATLAKGLFPRIGAQGAATLRLGFSALMLGLATRPWRGWRPGAARLPLLVYGLSLGAMNTLFYMALARIPLGIAVALEFVGPLGVAMAASRRPLDFAWVALVVVGLALLLPLHGGRGGVDPFGAALALGAGACWALYIVFGRRAGAAHGGAATGLGMLIAAAVFVPIGVARIGPGLFAPALLPSALLLALFSSALPYSLEMAALTRVPPRLFGMLMSLEPACGAVAGLMVLREVPSLAQCGGIAAVMLASLGAALTGREGQPDLILE